MPTTKTALLPCIQKDCTDNDAMSKVLRQPLFGPDSPQTKTKKDNPLLDATIGKLHSVGPQDKLNITSKERRQDNMAPPLTNYLSSSNQKPPTLPPHQTTRCCWFLARSVVWPSWLNSFRVSSSQSTQLLGRTRRLGDGSRGTRR